jgi:hypothetical protein
MTIRKKRTTRAPLRSPGSPPVAGRAEQERFWQAIAAGLSCEDAALKAGVSPAVGPRLFRKAGGMPPAIFRSSAKPLSARYLSLAEREEIALLNVQGHSLKETGRRLGRAASTISRELRRNAATHGGGFAYRATTAQWHADRSARRPKADQACSQRRLAHLCGRATCRCYRRPKRRCRCWSRRSVEGSSSAQGSAMG